MTTFNNTLTKEEAKVLFTFKGQVNYPDTTHNRSVMADVVSEHLKTLKTLKNAK
jgi:hypothetical protein